MIESSKFLNNYADQIDLDFCTGEVKESKFYGNVENSEGDGLDLSGSEMFLHHNVFENFQDKGLSVGEATEVLVFKNTFIENNIGAAIKDLSVAYIVGNQFKDNAADLSLYKKKFIFGGATAHLYNNSFINEKVFKVDKESSVYDLSQEAASKLVQGWS